VVEDARAHLVGRITSERPPADSERVEHHAQSPEIGARVGRLAAKLLGRHVGYGADQLARLGQAHTGFRLGGVSQVGPDSLREAEVEDLGPSVGRDEHVGAFQIAVHDAVRVRVGQRVRDLRAVAMNLGERQRLLARDDAERPAFHQLHRDVGLAVGLPHFEDRGDADVVQGRSGARLAQEPRARSRVFEPIGWKELERDVAVETLVVSAIDLAHAASAELLDDAVVAEVLDHGRSARSIRRRQKDSRGAHGPRQQARISREGSNGSQPKIHDRDAKARRVNRGECRGRNNTGALLGAQTGRDTDIDDWLPELGANCPDISVRTAQSRVIGARSCV
jgi:hypothetical protein